MQISSRPPNTVFVLVFLMVLASCEKTASMDDFAIDHLQGEMAGEVTASSVILQSRLTAPFVDADGDVKGEKGVARFELATNARFENSFFSDWLESTPEHDFILKAGVRDLESNQLYYYRLVWGPDKRNTRVGEARSFKTHPGAEVASETRFVVVTGMHYGRFRQHERGQQPDAALGYPALVSIAERDPDFFVGTGDNVYYDHLPLVTSIEGMRKKWHEQFIQQRYIDLFASVPTYWEKDDHDLRYDDCDSTDTPKDNGNVLPLPGFEDGIRIFNEQLPILDPNDPNARPYRTHRVSKDLQIWLLEGRDFRSPNLMPDGPDKTMWGVAQREWLKETLLASDAAFKVIISPTPMIGPDDLRKKDNHTNQGGFRYEGDAFFEWALANDLNNKGLYIVCGDRHWQYHSVHPLGFEEFSSGALVDGNSRLGVVPGDPKSTDPQGVIEQVFTSPEPSGGFLEVHVEPASSTGPATISFNFFDENGVALYAASRQAQALK